MYLPDGTLLQGGKYKTVRFISSGGFGCTYEAEHVMLKKRVAIKEFFVKDFCNRDETTAHVTVGTTSKRGLVDKLRAKFIDEACALSSLQHPGIVRVSDVFEENGTAYFVMDFIDGSSLSEILKREGHLPEQKALKYIRQVAEALRHVHAHNRLHLDVKPGNIMIDKQGNAVLIDFGASKQYDEENGANTSTLMGKTLGYAPLEQMSDDVVKFTPATDIYSLGATLYKLITGVTPPSANLLAAGDTLAPLPATVSFGVSAAISAAMRTKRLARPQSIDEFLAILNSADAATGDEEETIIEGGGKGSHDTDTHQHPLTPKKGKAFPTKTVAIAVCLVLVAALAGVYFYQRGASDEPTTGTINGHEWVDLGLSVKWATCNVGALSPSGYGDYYAWGETSTKSEYTEANCKTYGKSMDDIAGNPQYDAARANWGGTWRLPTWDEIEELVNECEWEWTTQKGHNGYEVTGPNGNSIFLPAAGWRYGSSLDSAGKYGYCWSATPYEDDTNYAYDLYFDSDSHDRDWGYRSYGRSVRPVSE